MTEYHFSGKIIQGRGKNLFERNIEAESLDHAREKLLSQLGSEHSIPRSKIQIEEEEAEA